MTEEWIKNAGADGKAIGRLPQALIGLTEPRHRPRRDPRRCVVRDGRVPLLFHPFTHCVRLESAMGQPVRHLYRLLIGTTCVSMVATFVIVLLGILARQVTFIDIQGWMPTQAGAIAATLFLHCPRRACFT